MVYRPPGGGIQGFSHEMAKVMTGLSGFDAYIMGDFNVDLLKGETHGPTTEFMQGFMSRGYYPLISLPTRITDTTATLIDNIWTSNLRADMASGLVTVRLSDHLPTYAFVGGNREGGIMGGTRGKRRQINDRRIERFAQELKTWYFDIEWALGVEGNVARFRNEFRDLYDTVFPWVESKKNKKDLEKPWLDDDDFRAGARERGSVFEESKGNTGSRRIGQAS